MKVAGLVFAYTLLSAVPVFACPDISLSGDTAHFTGSQLLKGRTFDVTAGGDNSIPGCGIRPQTDRGDGYVTTRPDFTFGLDGMGGVGLRVSVVSACDSVLLLNTGAANWYYDDDDNGNLDARVTLSRPTNGWLDIWVGTIDGEHCDARLTVQSYKR